MKYLMSLAILLVACGSDVGQQVNPNDTFHNLDGCEEFENEAATPAPLVRVYHYHCNNFTKDCERIEYSDGFADTIVCRNL